ncbi:hypothetical protein T05_4664 [Trichinella murrelli]|uniref:Uncharacterized protein n=1 Tax=Trichinella murrelli TaxID=144512 RepID=A0A0V0T320_9BILA|nr:hypothetical protein T05_4485 [Trichinella murrelli]KRX33329.1 hypothetical protein T05_2423 [Trichinella murrelli]KRX33476.1 hypothetical protein T05_4664 [Trichinella murrelli]
MSNERLPLWNALNINIRSNNHLEGWHNRLDKNAGGSKLRFYRLLQLLMEEADCTISRCFDHHFRLKLDKQNILVTTPAVDTLEQFRKALMYVAPELNGFRFLYMDGGVDDEEQDHKSHVILERSGQHGHHVAKIQIQDCHYAMRQMQHPCLTGLSFPLLSSGTKESQ